MTTPVVKEAPENRDRDGQCPALNCGVCWLKPATGRCPWMKKE